MSAAGQQEIAPPYRKEAERSWSYGGFRLVSKLALLAVLVGGGLELFWWAFGYGPSVRDDAALWSSVRREANGSPRTAVLIGTSRVHDDLDPRVFSKEAPGFRWLQLAIDGTMPFLVLKDLANDPSFRGLVLCEIQPNITVPDSPGGLAEAYISYYHHETWSERLEGQLRRLLQSHLRLARDEANITVLVNWLRTHRGPPPRVRSDRFEKLSFTPEEGARGEQHWIELSERNKARSQTAEDPKRYRQIAKWAEMIEHRGGKVVFLNIPATGRFAEEIERLYPQSQYWDQFVRSQKSLCVNLKDFPEFKRFQCPDGSHLDFRSTAEFTSTLTRLLIGKGVISR